MESWLKKLLEKQLIYDFDPLLCFDNNTAENTYRELQNCNNFFEILFVFDNPGKISKAKSLFKRKSKLSYLGTEGRRKLKLGEVKSPELSKSFEKKPSKNLFDLTAKIKV